MKNKNHPQIYKILVYLLLLTFISGCTTQESVKVKAWIDTPRDGATFEANTPVSIMSHAYAKDGFGEIMLYINGEAYRRDAAPPTDDDLISITQEWVPAEVGQYVVEVKVIDVNGEESLPALIGIEIREKEMASATPLDTVTPTEDISPTPVISITPTLTPTYTPTIAYYTNTPTIHPTVTAKPVDNEAPPIPMPMVPANGLELSCRATQTLVWQPVNDMSGIDGYYVKLERLSGTSTWESIGGYGPVSGKQIDVNVDCGIKYRWMVRAQDGAGNFSAWSSMSEFIIVLE